MGIHRNVGFAIAMSILFGSMIADTGVWNHVGRAAGPIPEAEPARVSVTTALPDPGTLVTPPDAAAPTALAVSAAVDAQPTEKLIASLGTRILRQAGSHGAVTGTCATAVTGATNQQVSCILTYEGLSVPFDVTVKAGTPVFTYTARQRRAVLAGAGVRAAWYRLTRTQARPGSARCDSRLPAAELTDFGQLTVYTCRYRALVDARQVVGTVVVEQTGVTFRARS